MLRAAASPASVPWRALPALTQPPARCMIVAQVNVQAVKGIAWGGKLQEGPAWDTQSGWLAQPVAHSMSCFVNCPMPRMTPAQVSLAQPASVERCLRAPMMCIDILL